jgi:hypothetical protein
MKPGHKKRFQERLEKEYPREKQHPRRRKSSFILLKIAASVLILMGIFYFLGNKDKSPSENPVVEKSPLTETKDDISLGDLSPDLKKVENYYTANINFELSKLEVSEKNKALVEGFMNQLATLNAEYKRLNTELNRIGPNDQTITALIKNLQLRLQLLQRLKEKLNQLKPSKNETVTTTSV